ncbi:hypothetical protein N7645_17510 [Pseudomonas juntendi]|uniref:hypothetical protein n=1 Tax=Pseudomonas juntendi TaxID=2666183 RepID=UPI0024484340|nr:hypothetical protein [Pseudomonas juntendi]MDG9918537.1 hypothetical protein [Pseudomonas juntendi]MDH0508127.1 hypothetical protein [Pseudomonas juntendi]MDH1043203.1 hypothetical protein [Pseudomonas juntendi]
MSIKFATQATAETRYVQNREARSFREFFDTTLSNQRISDSKDGSTFTPSYFRAPERNIENVVATSMIVLDIDQKPGDDQVGLEEVEDALIDMNLEHAVYTSFSNTAECPRFRVVFPLDRPVHPDAFQSVAAAALEALDEFLDGRLLKVIDGCWRETSRCYYTFTTHPDRRNGAISFYNPGQPLNALELKMARSSYGIDAEYTKTQKPRAPDTAVSAQGRSFELNRYLGGLFRSASEDQIVQRILQVDQEQNPGNEYFHDQNYARQRPRPGESADAAALRACKAWVKSHLNWLRRKARGIDTTIVHRTAQSREPMPTHEALIRLKNLQQGKTKAGGETALAEFEIVSGEHAGRHVWHRFYGQGNHPTAIKISTEMLEKLKTAASLPSASFADVLKARDVVVHARIKLKPGTNGFPAQNEVGTFFAQA